MWFGTPSAAIVISLSKIQITDADWVPRQLAKATDADSRLIQGKNRAGSKGGLPVHCLFLVAGPATVLSHKCDIPSLFKDDQIARENRLPVHCRRLRSLQHHIVIPVAKQMSLPRVCLPPV